MSDNSWLEGQIPKLKSYEEVFDHYYLISKRYLTSAKRPLKTDCFNEGHERPIVENNKTKLVEYNQDTINLAKGKNPKLDITQGDIRQLPFKDNQFDLVLDLSTIDHIPREDVQKVFDEYSRVLDKNGDLVIVVWLGIEEQKNEEWSADNQYSFNHEFFREELGKKFDILAHTFLLQVDQVDHPPRFLFEFICRKKHEDTSPITVYTCVINMYDTLNPLPDGVEGLAYLDGVYTVPKWRSKIIKPLFYSNTRNARMVKALSHLFVDTEYSLWIDGNVELLVPPEEFLAKYKDRGDIVLFSAKDVRSTYEEARVVLELNLDSPETVNQQMERYFREGFTNDNIHATGIILRHHTPKVIEFNNFWWSQLCRHSLRDQLSFDYSVWKTGVKVGELDGNWYDTSEIKLHPHTKVRSFGSTY